MGIQGLYPCAIGASNWKTPAQITRYLAAPGNWTIDTVSDLLLGMGGEPVLEVVAHLGDRLSISTPKSEGATFSAIPSQDVGPMGEDECPEVAAAGMVERMSAYQPMWNVNQESPATISMGASR